MRIQLLRSVRLTVAVALSAAMLTAVAASPASAEEAKTFTGSKGCYPPISQISPPAPGGYCVIITASLKVLRGATVYYTDATFIDNVLQSPVTLVATDERGSTATGHCTYFFLLKHGHCEYWAGTHKLEGFHANLMVGFSPSGVVPLTGTYWFDRDEE